MGGSPGQVVMGGDWLRTQVLWCRNRPLYQLCHNQPQTHVSLKLFKVKKWEKCCLSFWQNPFWKKIIRTEENCEKWISSEVLHLFYHESSMDDETISIRPQKISPSHFTVARLSISITFLCNSFAAVEVEHVGPLLDSTIFSIFTPYFHLTSCYDVTNAHESSH